MPKKPAATRQNTDARDVPPGDGRLNDAAIPNAARITIVRPGKIRISLPLSGAVQPHNPTSAGAVMSEVTSALYSAISPNRRERSNWRWTRAYSAAIGDSAIAQTMQAAPIAAAIRQSRANQST